MRNFKKLKINLLWFWFCILKSTKIAVKFHIHWSTSDFVAGSTCCREISLIVIDDSNLPFDPKVFYLLQTKLYRC